MTVERRDGYDDLRCGWYTGDPRRWPREGIGTDVLLRGPDSARDALGEGATQPVAPRPHRPHRYLRRVEVARRPCRAHWPRSRRHVGRPDVARYALGGPG